MPDAAAGDIAALTRALTRKARRAGHRRLLVLHGAREKTYEAARTVLDALATPADGLAVLTDAQEAPRPEAHVRIDQATNLMGTTQQAIVHDAHDRLVPNALGRTVGAVQAGGLYVLLTPPLEAWPSQPDAFDEHLVVHPYTVDDVAGRFKARLADTLFAHEAIAIVDTDAGTVEHDGHAAGSPPPTSSQSTRASGSTYSNRSSGSNRSTGPNRSTGSSWFAGSNRSTGSSRSTVSDPLAEPAGAPGDAGGGADAGDASPHPGRGSGAEPPEGARFPAEAYHACRTRDQANALHALEALCDPAAAIVVEADRGRGKSSAAGLAAGALAAGEPGADVLVVAPRLSNARELMQRARELLDAQDARQPPDEDTHSERSLHRHLATRSGGRVRYARPGDALEQLAIADGARENLPDAILVDEAASLPVRVLETLLDAGPPIAFATTIHGYEGAGRGFTVRFKDRLRASERDVREVAMREPIRYAPGDPVEAWLFHALMLDARPPVDALVDAADPGTVHYRAPSAGDLAADQSLLGEVFGLLVQAHYRTTPNDLARLLDAPNLHVRTLWHDGHVASVALLAEEGGLPRTLREASYEGTQRVRGHMLPDVLASQLRDEDAGQPRGWRVMRIATHPAARSRGLGTRLLARVRGEAQAEDVDWLGTGFGATPQLLRFWAQNGYETVHLSTSRNPASGEHSAIMLDPVTDEGRRLRERSIHWFLDRVPSVLADALADLEPDVVRRALATVDADVDVALTEREQRLVAASAYGPGMYDANPRPFRRLALKHLVEQTLDLDERAERLLVAKVLQARPWNAVATRLGFHGRREAMLALGDAYKPLVDAHGGDAARGEAARYR